MFHPRVDTLHPDRCAFAMPKVLQIFGLTRGAPRVGSASTRRMPDVWAGLTRRAHRALTCVYIGTVGVRVSRYVRVCVLHVHGAVRRVHLTVLRTCRVAKMPRGEINVRSFAPYPAD